MMRRLRPLLLLACLALAPMAHAAEPEETTVAGDSEALRAEASTIREAAEKDFRRTSYHCYDKFLVNACLDDARETRTERVRTARKLEAKANRIDRAERIRAMQTRLRKTEEREAQ